MIQELITEGYNQAPTKAEADRVAGLKLKKLEILKKIRQYEQDNKIEFFGIVDPTRNMKGPNPLQSKLLTAWEDPRYKVFTFTGANRIGKTTIGTIIAFSTLFGKWPWSNKELRFRHKLPRKVRYIGQDWEKHIKAVVEPELTKWWPKNRALLTKKNNQGIEAHWVDEASGSALEIMSNNQESGLHEGWSGDLVIYDEPPKRDIRVANARGLIDRMGRELFCMTLLKEAWVDREVIKAVDEKGLPDLSVFNVTGEIYDNVGFGLTLEGVEQFAKTLTEDEKEARLRGVPSYMSGLVYPSFKRQVHLKPRFKIPLDWIVDIGFDIHPREKQAVLFIATEPRGYRYTCFELWQHGDGTQIAEEAIRIIKQNALRVGTILIDPLSKADSNVDKDEVQAMMENSTYNKIERVMSAQGYGIQCAVKAKASGILEVKNHLISANNEPTLFVFNDLARFIYEIEGYMYDEEGAPKDEDDHMMENLYRLLLINTKWSKEQKRGKNQKPKNWKVV